MTTFNPSSVVVTQDFVSTVVSSVQRDSRFAGLFASVLGSDTRLNAVLDSDGQLEVVQTVLRTGQREFPSLGALIPSARWYERELHDLFELEPQREGGNDPLVFARAPSSERSRSDSGFPTGAAHLDLTPLPAHLRGEGVFTISYGPVRSGVFESVEYVVETSGEDIPHLRTRPFYKHRGVESLFGGLSVHDGVLLAERCEGVASLAHAWAFCAAVEEIAGVQITPGAALVRVIHAELERIANHLDSTIRHAEAAGQAVAYARFSLHKERVQRLRAQLCGSRFSRGVVVPGGVAAAPLLNVVEILAAIDPLELAVANDMHLLMDTPSFLDRLRGTGVLPGSLIEEFGALGPLARGSGLMHDVRWRQPYGAYKSLDPQEMETRVEGDALARQRVRVDEIAGSFRLIRDGARLLDQSHDETESPWTVYIPPGTGSAVVRVEAPQGELLSLVEMRDGILTRVKQRSASFHNLALFSSAFPGDILTDFAFIEASFGLSIAGVSS
ncbi:MAG: NADH-quinone oxidoreductase subunit C [Acidimicrobiales bacterium]